MSTTFKKFLSYYKPYMKSFSFVLFCSLMSTAMSLLIPVCTRYITKDLIYSPGAVGDMLKVGFIMLGLVVLLIAFNSYYDYRGHSIGAKMERDIRQELFEHIETLPFSFFDNRKTGSLMSTLTNDLNNLSELYHHLPEDLINYFVRFIGAFIILGFINIRLTLIVFTIIPVMTVFTLIFSKKLRAAYDKSYANIAAVNSAAEDSLSGIRVVKSFANEGYEAKKFSKINQSFFKSRCSIYGNESLVYNGTDFFINLAPVLVVIFGAMMVQGGAMDIADIIIFIMYVGYITVPIQHLTHLIGQFQGGYAGFKRFHALMETEAEIKDGELDKEDISGDICFENVSFRYPETENDVLKNVSLSINRGDRVALVGHSGVGKTTLCSLIPRFYDVTEGRILIDGEDVRNYKQSSLRKNIGVVEQSIYLFDGTVAENIAYGNPSATREEIASAAKKSGADRFIDKLPKGYDTLIGEKGVKLSGGQKQLISIARVFLKNPPVIIFDEATSSLDNESERIVSESLEKLSSGRTTLVIAHRLSTIKNSPRIIVINDNSIAESGTHEELMELGGVYSELYTMM